MDRALTFGAGRRGDAAESFVFALEGAAPGTPDRIVTLPPQPKVVLVEFWTFACSNCIHMLPHVSAWHAAYAKRGLVVT